jgi:hypothetical protein
MDWDPDTAMDEEAAVQAEIERRRRAREAALKRGIGAATPTIQALQAGDRPASTPASTRPSSPGPQRVEGATPMSSKKPSIPFRCISLTNHARWPFNPWHVSWSSPRSLVPGGVQLC